jgi:hypothetical protein
MKFSDFNKILCEGKVDDLRTQYVTTNKIPEHAFERLVEIDKTDTKKYLQWMCKRFSEERDHQNLVRLQKYIPFFDDLVNKNKIQGAERDINYYKTIEMLYDKVKHFEENKEAAKTGGEIEREIAAGADKVFENDKVLIVKPKTKEASCKYGAGTKWCTAATDSSNWFKQYYLDRGVTLYYVIPKIKDVPKFWHKIAIAVESNGNKTAWDETDNSPEINPDCTQQEARHGMKMERVLPFFKSLGIPE